MRVFIYGAGNVGRSLARALRKQGWTVVLHAARRGPPARIVSDVLVCALREGDLRSFAERVAATRTLHRKAVVLHVAGSLSPEVLAPLRAVCRGVGQMHPMVSFASLKFTPSMHGAHALVDGDPEALRMAKRMARSLGMVPRQMQSVDLATYHAAAGLLAGGAVALAAVAGRVLTGAGVDEATSMKILGPLLRSVGDNLENLGLPLALTGAIRRGNAPLVRRHANAVRQWAEEHMALYLETAKVQVRLASEIGDASCADLNAVQAELRACGTQNK